MDPILLDIPDSISTERLTLRVPRPGDGAVFAASMQASLAELSAWLPWATVAYDAAAGELWARRVCGEFHTRRTLAFTIFERDGGAHVGGIGAHRVEWRDGMAEVGYWIRTDRVGRGYMAEALRGIVALLTDVPAMRRVEVRCDVRNVRSAAVARRCGFAHDGTLRGDSLGVDGSPRDTHVFSRLAGT